MPYRKPGVYSNFINNPGTIILGAGTRIPAIIGVAPTSFTITDEAVDRSSVYANTADALANTATSIIRVGDAPGMSNYSVTTDYLLTSGQVDWSPGGDEPSLGETYYVSYQYAKVAADYNAQVFTRMSDVEAEYGAPTYANTLSLGAKICFENGAKQLILVQVEADNSAGFTAAIDKLKYQISSLDATIIVPLSTSATVHTYLKTHVQYMSSSTQRKERYGLIAMAVGSTDSAVKSKAEALDYNRMILPYDEPKREVINDDGTYTERTLDSGFISCALAGMMTAFPVQEPMTRKNVNGFSDLNKSPNWLETEKDSLASSSVTVFDIKSGIIDVRHGITTDASSADNQEISVMLIRDYCIQNVRKVLDRIYIATPMTPRTEKNIVITTQATLTKIFEEGAITAFGDITATQNTTTPTQIDVSFSIKPAYPINTIIVTFTINPNL